MHGKPFKVWLLTPVVPKGKAKKFYNPWTEPYKVINRPSVGTYKIQNILNHCFSVVHFDRLKVCSPNIRIPQNIPKASKATGLPGQLPLVEENDEPVQDAVEELAALVPRWYLDTSTSTTVQYRTYSKQREKLCNIGTLTDSWWFTEILAISCMHHLCVNSCICTISK